MKAEIRRVVDGCGGRFGGVASKGASAVEIWGEVVTRVDGPTDDGGGDNG